jgi:hypothetical protein
VAFSAGLFLLSKVFKLLGFKLLPTMIKGFTKLGGLLGDSGLGKSLGNATGKVGGFLTKLGLIGTAIGIAVAAWEYAGEINGWLTEKIAKLSGVSDQSAKALGKLSEETTNKWKADMMSFDLVRMVNAENNKYYATQKGRIKITRQELALQLKKGKISKAQYDQDMKALRVQEKKLMESEKKSKHFQKQEQKDGLLSSWGSRIKNVLKDISDYFAEMVDEIIYWIQSKVASLLGRKSEAEIKYGSSKAYSKAMSTSRLVQSGDAEERFQKYKKATAEERQYDFSANEREQFEVASKMKSVNKFSQFATGMQNDQTFRNNVIKVFDLNANSASKRDS